MRPELTIAVPTYNRVSSLKVCINNILQEMDGLPVELLVSDNASPDETEDFMSQMVQKNPEISYFRNGENLGPDGNFLNCYVKAHGKYVLLIGDDDVLVPGAIKGILRALEKEPVMLFLNTSGLILGEPLKYSKPRLKDNGLLEFKDKNEFFKKADIFITFVSALVLKTDYVNQIENKEKYKGTHFIQSHIALETLKHDGLYIVDTQNCIAGNGNETVGYDFYEVWGKQYYNLLFTTGITSGLDRDCLDDIYLNNLKTTLADFILHFRRTCKGEPQWDKSCIMECAERYSQVLPMYKKLVYLPLKNLKRYGYYMKLKRKISMLLVGKK